jgi:hypothetical protein
MENLGADSFLYKPPVFEQLLGELKRYIDIADPDTETEAADTPLQHSTV